FLRSAPPRLSLFPYTTLFRSHQIGNLVCGFWVLGPKIPLHGVIAQTIFWQARLRADEVWELHGIADEEDRGMVADQIEVSLGSIELQRETAEISPSILRTQLTCDRRETGQHFGFDTRLEDCSLGVLLDVFGDREGTKRTGAFSVRASFGYIHTVEVLQCLNQVMIVQDNWAVLANGQRIAVADCGDTGLCC